MHLTSPVVLQGTTLRDLTDVAPVRAGELVVRRTRDLARGAVQDVLEVPGVTSEPASGTDLQRLWGHEEHQRRPRFRREGSHVAPDPVRP